MSANDGEPEIGVRVPFREVVLRNDVLAQNPPYDVSAILGAEIEGANFGPGFRAAFQHLLGDTIRVSGSAVSKMVMPEPHDLGEIQEWPILRHYGNRLQCALHPMRGSILVEKYYRGEIDLARLDPDAYLGLQVLIGLQGANLDISGVDQRDNQADTMEKMLKLLQFTYSYIVDGWPRGISVGKYYGRFSRMHLCERGDGGSGGVNIMCFPKERENRWAHMTNWRQVQFGRLVPNDAGWDMEIHFPSDMVETPIEMTGQPERLGEWAHHAARAIRTVVTHSSQPHIGESFAKKLEWLADTDVGLEDVVGVVANLLPAFVENPRATHELIKRSGLAKILPYYEDEVAERLAAVMERYSLREEDKKPDDLRDRLVALDLFATPMAQRWQGVQDRIRGQVTGIEDERFSRTWSPSDEKWDFFPYKGFRFHHLDELAPLVRLFLLVSEHEVGKLKPAQLETVRWEPAGEGVDFQQAADGALGVLAELSEESLKSGHSQEARDMEASSLRLREALESTREAERAWYESHPASAVDK